MMAQDDEERRPEHVRIAAGPTVFPGGKGILRNRHATRDSGISLVATTTGQIHSPRIRTATNDADGFNLAIVAAAMQVFDPLVVNADGERGGAWGTASAA